MVTAYGYILAYFPSLLTESSWNLTERIWWFETEHMKFQIQRILQNEEKSKTSGIWGPYSCSSWEEIVAQGQVRGPSPGP